MPMNLATVLTLARIASIPVLVLLFYAPWTWTHQAAAMLFLAAALTDWLDGWVARRFDQASSFGAFLDPVADKLMVVVALVLVLQRSPAPWLAVVCAVIIGREISISALREWMAELGQRASVRVGGIGKIKTIVQMTALTMLIWHDTLWGLPIRDIGLALLVIAAILTLWSAWQYLRAAWLVLNQNDSSPAS
ncbi:MAG: CDP-diacylglycerol--glycerol-3-phosphate 3-phosphatidyltransferase [Xanthomonadales bacterium]|nr:CDP-diacylglycerol--glycerol-3-phosphate 3-phosphatidyltransferase [Xanthomonadales bacterium]MCE7930361.1 CDP-diacylglycerol--glycerol-3-phosphate 3-phosphatidyltransferase [Xanthomonadales bacterium PRO6]